MNCLNADTRTQIIWGGIRELIMREESSFSLSYL